jgi:hypothetical protein
MPQLIVAVVAAAAAAAGPGIATAIGITTAAGFSAATVALAGAVIGSVLALGVSFAASSILGLNRPPKTSTQAGQDRRQMIRSAIAPRQVVYGRARVSGPLIYASSSGDDLRYLHVVVPLAGHPVDGIDALWINDVRIPWSDVDASGFAQVDSFAIEQNGEVRRLVRARFYNGTQTAADAELVAESTDGWSSNHVGRGVAYIYVRLEYEAESFPNGLQNVSAEIRGKRIYDPRNGTTLFSETPALAVLDYLRSSDGLACDDDEIDFDTFATAANICEEHVQVTEAGATHQRYVIGGAFTLDRTPIDVADEMLGSMGGSLVYVAGKYRVHAGAYSAPTDVLTVSDFAGPIELVTKPSRREAFNSVRGTYISPSRGWQAADFAPVVDAAALAADGEAIWQDIELPWTTDAVRAQRLATLGLRRARESLTLRAPVRYAGLRFSAWQMLSVTIADFGWSGKAFRITSWSFDPPSGIITLTLREESSASYAWAYDEAVANDDGRDTNLVSPFIIPAPSGLTLTEELYVAGNGAGVRTRAILTWIAAVHPFVTAYDVQVRDAASTVWRTLTGTQGELRAVADDLANGLYVWRVRGRSLLAAGAWAELQASIGNLAAVPPAPITDLAVQSIGGMAFLRWTQHPELDVRVGGRIEFRHTPNTSTPGWSSSTSIGDAVSGDASWAVLPLKAGTYLAKAVDAGGRYSTTAASIGSAQATALAYASVDSLTEHTAFSGTKTDTVVVDDTLRLDSGGDVDAAADFDAIADVDGLGGALPSGSYDFSGGIDLTAVGRVRLTASMQASISNLLTNIDARTDAVDDWLDWDGVGGGEADAWVEVRQTDDDPSGSPVWSPWRRLDASEFHARAFEFRAQLRSDDPAFNIHVSELSVTADEVA